MTNSIPKGTFLIGDFSSTAQIIERETSIVSISYEHADYYVRNLCALRCEERATIAVFRPFAFLKGSFPAGSMAAQSNAKK